MEIISRNIEWNEDSNEFIITGRGRISEYDIKCALSRNPSCFVIRLLNPHSLDGLKRIKEKTDIPYLYINNIANGSQELISTLPNGMVRLMIGYNAWYRKIENLPPSVLHLELFTYRVDDCSNLNHGLEKLSIYAEISGVDMTLLPSTLKSLYLRMADYWINLDGLVESIETLKLEIFTAESIKGDQPLPHVKKLIINGTCNNSNLKRQALSNLFSRFPNCTELHLQIENYEKELLSSIPSSVTNLWTHLGSFEYVSYNKNNVLAWAKQNPQVKVTIPDSSFVYTF